VFHLACAYTCGLIWTVVAAVVASQLGDEFTLVLAAVSAVGFAVLAIVEWVLWITGDGEGPS
jgi:hypothetical protein